MNNDEAYLIILNAFMDIAPDVDLESVPPDEPYRDELGIDSMDFLAIMEQVEQETGVTVPESDYDQIETLDGFVAYLVENR